MIECNSIKGGKIKISKDKLSFRPSVYAVIVKDGKILMTTVRSNGKHFFPGGGIDLGEKVEAALKREVMEETGIEVEIEKFLDFKEQFFYWDAGDEAYHMFNLYYLCKPITTDLLSDDKVDDEEAMMPRWIEIESLKKIDDNIEAVVEILKLL